VRLKVSLSEIFAVPTSGTTRAGIISYDEVWLTFTFELDVHSQL
jgi:hypothetical protein